MFDLILLIHDDVAVIGLAKRILQKAGYDVLLATHAADALLALEERLPSLVILAPEMDGKRGESLCKDLLVHPKCKALPVLLLGRGVESLPQVPVIEVPLDQPNFLQMVQNALTQGLDSAWNSLECSSDSSNEFGFPSFHEDSCEQQPTLVVDLPAELELQKAMSRAGQDPVENQESHPLEKEVAHLCALAQEKAKRLDELRQQREEQKRKLLELKNLAEEEERRVLAERRQWEAELKRLFSSLSEQNQKITELQSLHEKELSRLCQRREEATEKRKTFGMHIEREREVAEIPFPMQGSLSKLDIPSLLCRSWEAKVTGRIDVEGSDAHRTLWLEKGKLVAASSSFMPESLGAIALRTTHITTEQYQNLDFSENLSARNFALRLAELQYISTSEIYGLVRQQIYEIASSLFEDDYSNYKFTHERIHSGDSLDLSEHPYSFCMEVIRRRFSSPRIWACLGGGATLLSAISETFDVNSLGLRENERPIFFMIDGFKTVEQILLASKIDSDSALRVLYGCVVAGAVKIIFLDTSTLKPTLDVSQSASSDNKLKIEIARVAQKFQQVVNGDYFQILGLRKNASSYEVQEAYERLSREFARSRFMAVKDNSLHDHLDEIARALAEAAEVLGEDAIREQYARNLVEPV